MFSTYIQKQKQRAKSLLFVNTQPTKNLTFRAHIAGEEDETVKNTRIQHSQKTFKMAKSTLFFILSLIFLQIHFSFCTAILDLRSLKGNEIDLMSKGVCNQKIGECLTEPEMESEISRRVLMMQKKYISYETLRRDMVPCSRPGVSYYECHPGPANSYDRGCEVITRCARDVHDIND